MGQWQACFSELCAGWLMLALGREGACLGARRTWCHPSPNCRKQHSFPQDELALVAERGQPCRDRAPEPSICREVLLLMVLKSCPDALLVLHFQAAAKPTGKPYCTDEASHLAYEFVCNS